MTGLVLFNTTLRDVFKRWAALVSFGLIEQILLSGSSFAYTAVMAHHLGASGFGWFAIAWASMTLLEAAAGGFLGDVVPSIAERLRTGHKGAFRMVLLRTAFLNAMAVNVVAGIAYGISAAAGEREYGILIVSTAFAFLCVRMQNMIRRIYYLEFMRREAAVAAIANVTTLAIGSLVVIRFDMATAVSAMIVFGLAAAAAGGCFFFQLKNMRLVKPSVRIMAWARTSLWRSGRWLMASAMMSWLGNFGMVIILGALHGVELSGTLRTITTLTTPPAQITIVLMSIVVPKTVLALRKNPDRSRRHDAMRIGALIMGLNALYAAALTLAGGAFVHLLFGAPARGIGTLTIAIAAFGYALEGVRYGCNAVLVAEGRTAGLGAAQAISLAASLVLVPAASFYGINYVAAAITFCNNINTLIVATYFMRHFPK